RHRRQPGPRRRARRPPAGPPPPPRLGQQLAPHANSPPTPATTPAPNRRLRPSQYLRDPSMAASLGEHLQGSADYLDDVPAPGYYEPGQQRLRFPTRRATHPRNPDQPITLVPEMTLIA